MSSEPVERSRSFWGWFQRQPPGAWNEASPAFPASLDALDEELQRVHPDLSFALSVNGDPCELIVTAGGRVELFDLVEQLVAAAPTLAGWDFTALKPPSPDAFRTTYEGLELDPMTMWFQPLRSASKPDLLGLLIAIAPPVRPDDERAREAAWIVVDTLLGERSSAEEVAHVEVTALPPDPSEQGFIELVDLAKYIEWSKHRGSAELG